MGSLHVCFADMPQYGVKTPSSSKMQPHALAATSASADTGGGDDAIADHTKERTLSPSSESVSSTPQRYERNMGFFRHLSRRFGLRSQDDLVYCSGGEDDVQSSSTDSSGSAVQAAALRHHQCASMNSNTNTNDSCSLEHISCASSSENSSTIDIEEEHHIHSQQQLQLQQQQQQQHQGKERKSSNRASFSRLQRRSTSSLRRAFDKLTLSAAATRSLSCSGNTNTNSTTVTSSDTPIKSALKFRSNIELNKRSTNAITSTTTNSSSSTASVSSPSGKSKKSKAPPQRILRQPVSYTYLKGISGLPTQRVPRSSVCCQYVRR